MAAQRAGLREWLAVAAGTIGSFMALLALTIVTEKYSSLKGATRDEPSTKSFGWR